MTIDRNPQGEPAQHHTARHPRNKPTATVRNAVGLSVGIVRTL
jgi:hypothetical protein